MKNQIEKEVFTYDLSYYDKDGYKTCVEDNSLIKKVCSDGFVTEPKYVTTLQMNIVVTKCAKHMSNYILNK